MNIETHCSGSGENCKDCHSKGDEGCPAGAPEETEI